MREASLVHLPSMHTLNQPTPFFSRGLGNVLSRGSTIMPGFVGTHVKVHNGKSYVDLLITKKMCNHRAGQFVQTRVTYTFKKRKKGKK